MNTSREGAKEPVMVAFYRVVSGWFEDARVAFGFLTVTGSPLAPSPSSLAWFPMVGIVLGGVLGCVWWLSAKILPFGMAAAVVVVLDLGLTGMLHFDGLCDSADGLLGHLSPERRLEVMREPGVGAWGVGAGASTLGLRWLALSLLQPAPLLLAGLWCLSRSAMALASLSLPYARIEGGLLSAFRAGGEGDHASGTAAKSLRSACGAAAALGLLAAVAVLEQWRLVHGAEVLAAGALAGAAVILRARRTIGGVTGDVLGAMGVVLETVGLVAATLK